MDSLLLIGLGVVLGALGSWGLIVALALRSERLEHEEWERRQVGGL